MQNIFIELLPPWVETGLQPAFYDKESGTVLQQVSRMWAKMIELGKAFNDFSEDTAHTVNEYIAKFVELHDYVHDYFDNLDVQEEINNKLDQMAEDGTLQEIITAYIQANVAWVFDTVADMKQATNLVNGSYARTLGFHTLNDGGGALYKITDSGTADEMTVISVGNLFANLILEAEMTPEQFGCYGDHTNDDSVAFAKACQSVGRIVGKGKYKLDELTLNNVNIKADIYLIAATGLTFGNNVKFEGLIDNAQTTTLANSGRCIYITGSNNEITNAKFSGIFKGCGVVLASSSDNNRITGCIFEPSFKEDIHVAGDHVIIDGCTFKKHESDSVSPITDYDNAIKVSQYLDLTGSNGDSIIIKNNTIYEHGDNPIDCYTGATNVIIDGNFINSPAHECLEIKVGNDNEYNTNYTIVNNTLIGNHCMHMGIGSGSDGTIDSFKISDNYFETTAGSCVYITSPFNLVMDNCIFKGANTTNNTAINMAAKEGQTVPNRLVLNNCSFDTFQSLIPEACITYNVLLNNIHVDNVKRLIRVNTDVMVLLSNSYVKTIEMIFNAIAGKVFVSNSYLEGTIGFTCRTNGFVASAVNSIFKCSSDVANKTTGVTGKLGISNCEYSESNRLSNFGFTENVALTSVS